MNDVTSVNKAVLKAVNEEESIDLIDFIDENPASEKTVKTDDENSALEKVVKTALSICYRKCF